jgi:hypothetical protein
MHPTLAFHLAPECVFFEHGEIADDFERTCMDASLPQRATKMVVVDEKSGGRCSRQPMGGVTGNVLRQTLTVIPHHLRNVAPLLLDPDHSDADLRRMMISRTFGMSALSRTFGLSARFDVFKTECHSCGVLSEPNETRSHQSELSSHHARPLVRDEIAYRRATAETPRRARGRPSEASPGIPAPPSLLGARVRRQLSPSTVPDFPRQFQVARRPTGICRTHMILTRSSFASS